MATPVDINAQKNLVIIIRTSGLLSVLGSSWITAEILSDRRNKLRLAYHRFLLGMSLSDIVASFFWFLSSWCVPEGTWWGAAGNAATCQMQAFFTRFNITTALYNVALAVYYLLVLRFRWKESRIRKRVEPLLHFVAIATGLATAISGLIIGAFGSRGPYCHVPPGLLNTRVGQFFVSGSAWFIISIVVMTACMIVCFLHIRQTEAASIRHYRRSVQSAPLPRQGAGLGSSKSREFALQGTLYVAAFCIAYAFPIALNIRILAGKETAFIVYYIAHFFFPLQGFFNFFIYVRPRYRKFHRDFPEMPRYKVALLVLRRPFKNKRWRCSCCSPGTAVGDDSDDDGDAQLGAELALDSTMLSSQESTRSSIRRMLSWIPRVRERKSEASRVEQSRVEQRNSSTGNSIKVGSNHKVDSIGTPNREDVESGKEEVADAGKDNWREEE